MTIQKRKIILYGCILVFLIASSFMLFYSQGYIIDRDFNISQRGGIYIDIPLADSDIYINNKKEKTTGILNKGLFMSNLKTGEYSVLVAKEGYWPWAKTLEVSKGLVSEAKSVLIPENPRGDTLLKGKFTNIWASHHNDLLILKEETGKNYFQLIFYVPEKNTFLTIDSAFTKKLLTFSGEISNITQEKNSIIFKSNKGTIKVDFNFSKEIVSASYFTKPLQKISDYEKFDRKEDIKIWYNPLTNEVFADWINENEKPPYYICNENNCELPIKIFKSRLSIKNVEFFPGRKDVIIMAVGNGVYAIEIDGRSGRLAYPIYKGKKPTFELLSGEKNIYVLDDGSLIKIFLEK